MNLKEQYRRFRAWQKTPVYNLDKGTEEHRCPNCGHEFTGNYCPVCGQQAGDGRITWRWVYKSVMQFLGVDFRSLPYTLWQLLLRPGYLISEYLRGHRQVCYPPVNLIFILVVIYAILKQIFGISSPKMASSALDNNDISLITINWLVTHPGWGMISMTMLMILPTWFFFHFAPRHTRHTLPESAFIQIFMSSIILLIIILSRVVNEWCALLIPFYNYLTYRQLFGYGIWGTLWRTLLCFVVWLLLLLLIIAIISTFGYGFDLTSFRTGCILGVVTATILSVGYWIGKKNSRRQQLENQ